jgi:hypothetical protein
MNLEDASGNEPFDRCDCDKSTSANSDRVQLPRVDQLVELGVADAQGHSGFGDAGS